MSGETEQEVSAWTIDSLKEHLDGLTRERDRRYEQRFEAQEAAVQSALTAAKEAVTAALTAAKEAVDKAEAAIGERLTLLNEFRAQSKDEQVKFISRAEAEGAILRNTERIQELATSVQGCLTRIEMGVAEQRHNERFQVIETRLNLSEGKGSGYNSSYGILVSVAGVIGVIAAIYFGLHR